MIDGSRKHKALRTAAVIIAVLLGIAMIVTAVIMWPREIEKINERFQEKRIKYEERLREAETLYSEGKIEEAREVFLDIRKNVEYRNKETIEEWIGKCDEALSGGMMSDEGPENREYTEVKTEFREVTSYKYILPSCESTEEGDFTFLFEKTVPAETREEFIKKQILLNGMILGAPSTFVLTENYCDRADRDSGVAFINVSSVGTWKQVLTTYQLLFGQEYNYGYTYAWANSLAEDLSWECDDPGEVSDEELIECFSEDPGRLNLVYPCFIAPYSTEKQIQCAKVLAQRVFGLYSFLCDGEKDFLEFVGKTAEGWGVSFEPAYLKFSFGGLTCPLVIRTKYIEERVTDNFERDSFYRSIEAMGYDVPEDIDWQRNITELISSRVFADEQIEYERNILCFKDEEPVPVVWCSPESHYSEYENEYNLNGTIYLEGIGALAHEYAHYIHHSFVPGLRAREAWQTEALATYFGWEMNRKELIVFSELTQIIPATAEEYYLERFVVWVDSSGYTPREKLYTTEMMGVKYSGYYSIASYIVSRYGEETFGQLMLYPENAVALTGRDIDTIVDEWEAEIQLKVDAVTDEQRAAQAWYFGSSE